MSEKKITISINTKAAEDDKKTAVFPSRRRWKPGRRRRSGIRFYDMAYIFDGVNWTQLEFTDPESGNSIPVPPGLATLTIDYFNQIRDTILAIPTDEWKTTFRLIDEDYGAIGPSGTGGIPVVHYRGESYLFTDDEWNGDVFKPSNSPSTDLFNISFDNRVTVNLELNGGADAFKITTEPDYTADAVTLIPSNNMDVFLAPNLMSADIRAVHHWSLHPPAMVLVGHSVTDILDDLRFLYPRELFLEPLSTYYGESIPEQFAWGSISGYTNLLPEYTTAYNTTTMWRDHFGGVRAAQSTFDIVAGTSQADIPPSTVADVALYPVPPSMPTGSTVILEGSFLGATPINGTLAGAIKKGSTFYYVWFDV
jgi:hypothetical protein